MILFAILLSSPASSYAGGVVRVIGCPAEIANLSLRRNDPRRPDLHVGDPVRVFLEGRWQRGKVADFPENEWHVEVELESGKYGGIDLLTRRHYLDLRRTGVDLPNPEAYDRILGRKISYEDPASSERERISAYVVAIDLENGRLVTKRELKPHEAKAFGVQPGPDDGMTLRSIAMPHSIPMNHPYRFLDEPSPN